MTTKPFNIEEAKAGARVVTDKGEDVRIICWDFKNAYSIIGLVTETLEDGTQREYIDTWKEDGTNIHDVVFASHLRMWVSDEDSVADLLDRLHKYVRREFMEYNNSISYHHEDEVNLYVTRFIEEMTKQINKIEALRKQ